MNLAVALALIASVVGVVVAVLSSRFGRAPGWAQYKALALVAATAALYTACDSSATLQMSDGALRTIMRVQAVAAALHVASWLYYVRRQLGHPPSTVDRVLVPVLLALAALSLVPGAMLTDRVWSITVSWLGVTYRQPEQTLLGGACFFVQCAILLVPLVRCLRAARDGFRAASTHVVALAAILVTAVNDALVGTELLHGPLLLSLGFLVSVGAMGFALTRAFVDSARELDDLSRRLEHLVEERTGELVEAEAALLHAEKMAAIGRLSAGVAHEINNPAAAVRANVEYLRDGIRAGAVPADALESLGESLESIDRIATIVRQLRDLGRAAASAQSEQGAVSVGRVVQQALAEARTRLGPHVTTSVDVPEELHVRADESSLVQVLVNLLVNAAQATGKDAGPARVRVRARDVEAGVLIEVVDEGTGISAETRRRLFEPFYTTRAFGEGTGLGLSVSRGLVLSMGGDLYVGETRPGHTAMCLRLVSATRSM
jgi:signal transduction histidine kinase